MSATTATQPKRTRKARPLSPEKAKQTAEQLRADLAAALENGKLLKDFIATMPDHDRGPLVKLSRDMIKAIQKARSLELQMRQVQRHIQFANLNQS